MLEDSRAFVDRSEATHEPSGFAIDTVAVPIVGVLTRRVELLSGHRRGCTGWGVPLP